MNSYTLLQILYLYLILLLHPTNAIPKTKHHSPYRESTHKIYFSFYASLDTNNHTIFQSSSSDIEIKFQDEILYLLSQYGYTCKLSGSSLFCPSGILNDTINADCAYDWNHPPLCQLNLYNRNLILLDSFYYVKVGVNPYGNTRWEYRQGNPRINLRDEPIQLVLSYLNRYGYSCRRLMYGFECQYNSVLNVIYGHCNSSSYARDPIACQIDQIG